ncbi:MAG: hypothetical protein AAF581_14940 [Planctomycetota bacterium]
MDRTHSAIGLVRVLLLIIVSNGAVAQDLPTGDLRDVAAPGTPISSALPGSAAPISTTILQASPAASHLPTINLSSSGPIATTPGAVPFGTCAITCSGTPENESCGPVVNNGCNITPLSPANFVTPACGQSFCGTVWATGGLRDTDFYIVEPTQVTTISAQITSNLPVIVALLADAGGDCVGVDIIATAFNTGDCGTAAFSHTVPGGTYYVFVAPDPGNGTGLFNFLPCGGTNDYALTIDCVSPPCQLTASGTPEGEPVPTSTNNGCDSNPVVNDTIAPGQTIHGTVWADAGGRDSDWYEFAITGVAQTVDVTFTSEFPGQVFLLETGCPTNTLGVASSVACTPGTLGITLGAGTYVLAVAAGDNDLGLTTDGIPVGDPANEYLLTLNTTTVAPGCTLTCNGSAEPDACGFGTDDGCIGGTFLPLATDGTPACGDIFADNGVRDIDWYSFGIAVDATVTLTVASQFPGQVLLGTCGATPGVVNVIAQANSLDCNTAPAVLTAPLAAGSYIVVITSGTGPLGIGDVHNGYPCSGNSTAYRATLTTDTPTPSCNLLCTSAPENENCGQVINNGCNLPTPTFEPMLVGETRCGMVWADDNDRDSDWWAFTLTEPQTISWTVTGELPLNTFLISGDSDACNTPSSIVGGLASSGDCTPVASAAFDLSCGTHYLFVAPGDATGNGIFYGFPCGMGRNDYEITLSGTPATACLPPTLDLAADCDTGTIDINIKIGQCLTGLLYSVTDPQGIQVVLQSIPGMQNACSEIPFPVGPYTLGGTYTVELSGTCCSGGTVQLTQDVELPLYVDQTDIIWRATPNNPALPAGYSGLIPSDILLNNILLAPPHSRDVLVVDSLVDFACVSDLGPGDVLWALLGSFPDNHALQEAEALILIDLLAAGVSVYIEGGEIWGFDLPTSFADYDGVLGRSDSPPDTFNFDGDDSFTAMNGGSHDTLDLSSLTNVTYLQDNTTGNDSTDRLNPTATGLGVGVDFSGSNAGAIWFNDPDGVPDPLIAEGAYATAIYYVPDNPCAGRVIAQSWEYGGFGGNLTDLAGIYSNELQLPLPGVGFRRGNCNNDESTNIADVIFLLSFLFSSGSPTPPDCEDACDNNDDGGLNIADAITLLAALFNSPAPPLAEPFCSCGPDPTPDTLSCANYLGLDCP